MLNIIFVSFSYWIFIAPPTNITCEIRCAKHLQYWTLLGNKQHLWPPHQENPESPSGVGQWTTFQRHLLIGMMSYGTGPWTKFLSSALCAAYCECKLQMSNGPLSSNTFGKHDVIRNWSMNKISVQCTLHSVLQVQAPNEQWTTFHRHF